jgi:hypothetical protein
VWRGVGWGEVTRWESCYELKMLWVFVHLPLLAYPHLVHLISPVSPPSLLPAAPSYAPTPPTPPRPLAPSPPQALAVGSLDTCRVAVQLQREEAIAYRHATGRRGPPPDSEAAAAKAGPMCQ